MKVLSRLMVLLCMPVTLAHAQADLEIRKTVNNDLPAPGEPVEFTIEATNVGDEAASGVIVNDQLPVDLEMPAGTAAFPSTGTYDPVSGEWIIGDLDIAESAVLTLPAVVAPGSQTNCIANIASLAIDDALDDDNDRAAAVVRQNPDDHCVDLIVRFSISDGPLAHSCDLFGRFDGDVRIENKGPDAARDVTVDLDWTPDLSRNIRFSDADCRDMPGTVCVIDEIAPGEIVTVDVTSDSHQSYESRMETVTISASTVDTDYDPSNNMPSMTGLSRAFSFCLEIGDIDIPAPAIGPGCFIATAAYGTPLDARLDVLRKFRDDQLLTNPFGRNLVVFYYQHSPPIAEFIADRDWLRAVVRVALEPVIFAIRYPVISAILVFALIGALVIFRPDVYLRASIHRLRKARRRPANQ